MRRFLVVTLLSMVAILAAVGGALAQPAPEFTLGFKALADQIPNVVGEPLENEHWGDNGDSLQMTSKGLMAWRKADNWTAFTNGVMTWINGPAGVQSRPNDQRFDWEKDQPATQQPASGIPTGSVEARVSRVVDGDTIDVDIPGQGVKRLRYIGVNTPETVDPRRPVEWYGQEASSANKRLVEGQQVWLEKDVSETDRYGRLLRYVYLSDGRMVNAELVREGFAQASSYPPDVRYQEQLRVLEQEARQAQRGLWAPVDGSSPQPISDPEARSEWVTSSHHTARLYYHWTDQRWKSLAESNRRWFNTVDELQAAFPGRTPAQ